MKKIAYCIGCFSIVLLALLMGTEAAENRLVYTLHAPQDDRYVEEVFFSRDSQILVAKNNFNNLQMWKRDGRNFTELKIPSGVRPAPYVGYDGTIACLENEVLLLNWAHAGYTPPNKSYRYHLENGVVISTEIALPLLSNFPSSLTRGYGTTLAVIAGEGILHIIDAQELEVVARFDISSLGEDIDLIDFLGEDNVVLCTNSWSPNNVPRVVTVFNIRTGVIEKTYQTQHRLLHGPINKALATVSTDPNSYEVIVEALYLETEEKRTISVFHSNGYYIEHGALVPNGNAALIYGAGGRGKTWIVSLSTGDILDTLPVYNGMDVAVSPDSQFVVIDQDVYFIGDLATTIPPTPTSTVTPTPTTTPTPTAQTLPITTPTPRQQPTSVATPTPSNVPNAIIFATPVPGENVTYEFDGETLESSGWSHLPGGFNGGSSGTVTRADATDGHFSASAITSLPPEKDGKVAVITVSEEEISMLYTNHAIDPQGKMAIIRLHALADNTEAQIALAVLKGNMSAGIEAGGVDGSAVTAIPANAERFLVESELLLLYDEGEPFTVIVQASGQGEVTTVLLDRLEVVLFSGDIFE